MRKEEFSELQADVLRREAEGLLTRWEVRRNEFVDIDFKVEEDGGINFHIYPSVPRFTSFPGGAERFAKEVEQIVAKFATRRADVVAELHYEEGTRVEYRNGEEVVVVDDTRVYAPYRNPDGSHKPLFHGELCQKLWFKIRSMPGVLLPKEQVAEIICDNILAAAKRLALV